MKPAWNIWDLRDQARRRLPRAIFEFVDRGSEDEVLLGLNRAALDRARLVPRALRDVSSRDQSIELFGRRIGSPMVIAPTGTADLVAYKGETAIATAAARAGIPFTLATSSTTRIADVARIATAGFWMQMYLWDRRDLSFQVVERAAEAGAEVLILTVDTPTWPNREFNKRNGMANPIVPNPTLALDFMLHPRWSLAVLCRYLATSGMPRFVNYPDEIAGSVSGKVRIANSASVSWADVAELKRRFPGKLVLKGLLSREDAIAAADNGVDGIVVSNHGARNFDASPASFDVLAEIVDAVGERMTVLFDGGVRRGSDVAKALAVGAKAVLVARPTLYGAAAGGHAGAARALEILSGEIDFAMAMLGLATLAPLDRGYLLPGTVRGV
jgi:L-lactate dehydrogenase (cytochrome)/(S)-mandelate dehydrogenase